MHVGEDVGHYGGSYKVTYDLYKKYGEMRLLDTPICGTHLLTPCFTSAVRNKLFISCLGLPTLYNRLTLQTTSKTCSDFNRAQDFSVQ